MEFGEAKKTRRRRRAFHIPFANRRCARTRPLGRNANHFHEFTRKAPILRHRGDLYLYSPRAVPYTETSIRARYHRWLKKTPEGKKLCTLWQKWVADQIRKYEWDIDADDAANPTIHGLRGTGILLRYSIGYEVDHIANDIGMSRPMVERYMRFKDQMEVAAGGGPRPRLGDVLDLLGIWRGASFADAIQRTGFGEPGKGAPHGDEDTCFTAHA